LTILFEVPGLSERQAYGVAELKNDKSNKNKKKSHCAYRGIGWIVSRHTFIGEFEICMIKEKD
jgi:hypothetical protein